MKHIVKTRYTDYVYQGGEPLLYSEHMLQITDIIRKEIPEAAFRTYTNGLNITENLVVQMNDRQVSATISVEADGYKGLKNLIDKATESTKILDNIKALKNKNIRTVTQIQQPFAKNIMLLHAVFPNIQIEIVPDYTTITHIKYSDLVFMQNEFKYIKEKTNGDTSWLIPLQAFYNKCTAQSDWYILDTGLIYEKCPLSAKAKSGCRKFASQMPSHLFEFYRQISKELNPQCQSYLTQ